MHLFGGLECCGVVFAVFCSGSPGGSCAVDGPEMGVGMPWLRGEICHLVLQYCLPDIQ